MKQGVNKRQGPMWSVQLQVGGQSEGGDRKGVGSPKNDVMK